MVTWGRGLGKGNWRKGFWARKMQTSSYKRNKSCRGNVELWHYNVMCNLDGYTIYRRLKRIDSKISSHKEKIVIFYFVCSFFSCYFIYRRWWMLPELMWWSSHNIGESNHHAIHCKFIQWCASIISQKNWEEGVKKEK